MIAMRHASKLTWIGSKYKYLENRRPIYSEHWCFQSLSSISHEVDSEANFLLTSPMSSLSRTGTDKAAEVNASHSDGEILTKTLVKFAKKTVPDEYC